jgi:hypothetical protein
MTVSPFNWRAIPAQVNWSAGAKSHRQTLIDATRQNGESTLGWAAKSTVQTPAPKFQKKRKRG